MGKDPEQPARVIEISQEATFDLYGVQVVSIELWGFERANRYLEFLESTIQSLAASPQDGVLIGGPYGQLHRFTAKLSRRKESYGHYIFYKFDDNRLQILRILHTAMNWPDHIDTP